MCGLTSCLPFTNRILSCISRVLPATPTARLMKSRSGSCGYLNTTTSPRRMSRYGMRRWSGVFQCCLLYTSDAADEEDSVDLGGRRIIKKKKKKEKQTKKR